MMNTIDLDLNFNLSSLTYDLITYFSIVILLFILEKKKRISQIDLFFLIIFCSTPLFFNNIIFHWGEFPDQKKYVDKAYELRNSFTSSLNSPTNSNVFYSSLVYSIAPVLSFSSINSIAFVNKILIVSLFVFFKKKNVNKFFLYSLILYPSIIIYSSLSLREVLIIFFMLISGYYFFQKNYFIFLISTIMLFLIKEQYAFFLTISLIFYRYFIQSGQRPLKFIAFFFISLVCYFLFRNQLFEIVENYRNGFIKEIGGYQEALNGPSYYDSSYLNTDLNYVFKLIFAYLKTFIYPFLSGISLIKTIFFLDNILYSGLFFLNCLILFKHNKKNVCFWLVNYLIVNSIISYISINDMTLLRYKFPWVIFYIFCLSYTCRNKQLSKSS